MCCCCVFGRRWVRQHHSIEQLNAQAHVNARNKSDPFVLESLITFEKLPTLISMLVTAEAWIDRIFPSVQASIPADRSMRAYYMVSRILLPRVRVLLEPQHRDMTVGVQWPRRCSPHRSCTTKLRW